MEETGTGGPTRAEFTRQKCLTQEEAVGRESYDAAAGGVQRKQSVPVTLDTCSSPTMIRSDVDCFAHVTVSCECVGGEEGIGPLCGPVPESQGPDTVGSACGQIHIHLVWL